MRNRLPCNARQEREIPGGGSTQVRRAARVKQRGPAGDGFALEILEKKNRHGCGEQRHCGLGQAITMADLIEELTVPGIPVPGEQIQQGTVGVPHRTGAVRISVTCTVDHIVCVRLSMPQTMHDSVHGT